MNAAVLPVPVCARGREHVSTRQRVWEDLRLNRSRLCIVLVEHGPYERGRDAERRERRSGDRLRDLVGQGGRGARRNRRAKRTGLVSRL
jgi:hypothetical protein